MSDRQTRRVPASFFQMPVTQRIGCVPANAHQNHIDLKSQSFNIQHLGNDSMISMISEARARFLYEFGIRENDDNGIGIIVTDLATTYKTEAHARDRLQFEVGVMDFNKYGGDIVFRITRPSDKKLVAMAKSGFVFFDRGTKRVVPMPDAFHSKFSKVNWIA